MYIQGCMKVAVFNRIPKRRIIEIRIQQFLRTALNPMKNFNRKIQKLIT